MKKKILFIVLSIILIGAIFYGYTVFHKQDRYMEATFRGFGIIKNIREGNVLTMAQQSSPDKIFRLKITEESKFYHMLSENGKLKAKQITLNELNVGDNAYFEGRPDISGIIIVTALNIQNK